MKKRPPWLGPLAALVVVYVLFAVLTPPGFVTGATTLTIAQQTVIVGICALGMTMVIVTGGIDLSIGSVVALTTVVVARLLRDGFSPAVAVVLALSVSAGIGAVTGLLVGRFRMMPFVVTLGTMSALRGAAKGLANESTVQSDARGLDELLTASVASPGVWIALALAAAAYALLTFTRFGRHVFAVGSNEAAARLCGIDPAKVKLAVYALSGVLTGVAGIMQFSQLSVGDPTVSVGLELDVIAAVVIGGAPLTGGQGSVVGSVLGALLMIVIRVGATQLGMPGWVQEIVTGGIIVVAVALDRARHRRRRA
jgi:ribose/xylose/arabinose/galactoside ABC-type transport system permease subunit